MTDISREALVAAVRLAETSLRVKPLVEIAGVLRDRVDALEQQAEFLKIIIDAAKKGLVL